MALTGSWCAPAGLRPLQRPHPPERQAPTPAAATAVSSEQLEAVVQVLENRLLELERAQSRQTVKASATMQAAITAPELRKILTQSEARQRGDEPSGLADLEGLQRCAGHRLHSIAGCDRPGQGVTNQQLRQHRDSIEYSPGVRLAATIEIRGERRRGLP